MPLDYAQCAVSSIPFVGSTRGRESRWLPLYTLRQAAATTACRVSSRTDYRSAMHANTPGRIRLSLIRRVSAGAGTGMAAQALRCGACAETTTAALPLRWNRCAASVACLSIPKRAQRGVRSGCALPRSPADGSRLDGAAAGHAASTRATTATWPRKQPGCTRTAPTCHRSSGAAVANACGWMTDTTARRSGGAVSVQASASGSASGKEPRRQKHSAIC